jgi:hypothetical protein
MFCVFLFSCTLLSAQKNANLYHSTINRAELLICDEKYEKALLTYDSAFKMTNNFMCADVYNAAICSDLFHNNKKTYGFYKKLMSRGFDTLMLEKIVSKNFRNTKYWQKIIKQKPTNKIDTTLNNRLNDLLELDQSVRTKSVSIEYFNSVDSLIFISLDSILKKYSYPSEELMGIRKNEGNYPMLRDQPINTILSHHVQRGGDNCNNIINKAFSDLKLSPNIYAFFNFKKKSPSDLGCILNTNVLCVINEKKFYRCSSTDIDARRSNIGLSTAEELKKKLLFSKKNNLFRLALEIGIHKVNLGSIEEEKKIIEKFHLIELE